MNRKLFLKTDEDLKSSITNEVDLDDDEKFWGIMNEISSNSCSIFGMKYVAYRNPLSDPLYEERNDYFDSVESILELIYTGFSNASFEEKIKMSANKLSIPRTNDERFELIQKIKGFVPKLLTSWVEKC